MVKKSLVNYRFMNFISAVALLIPVHCGAIEVIRPEDEKLLWEINAPQDRSVRNVFEDRVLNPDNKPSNVEEIIFIQEPLKPMRAPGLGAVRVPEDINEKVQKETDDYDDPTVIKVNPKTPRSVMYLIGKERKAYEASRKEWFNLDYSLLKKQEPEMRDEQREALIKEYRDRINDCIGSRQERLDVEISLLGSGNSYDSAAYLSQTFEAIEQCYDEVGVDILRQLYGDDDEAMEAFEQRIAKFHVNTTRPGINTKYCGESCSLRAMAEWQLEEFANYRTYLAELIDQAPAEPKVKVATNKNPVPVVDEEIWFDEDEDDDTFIYEDEKRGPIRVRKVEAPSAQPVMMYDDDGVPFIDESEL